jgi:hypothetical protein
MRLRRLCRRLGAHKGACSWAKLASWSLWGGYIARRRQSTPSGTSLVGTSEAVWGAIKGVVNIFVHHTACDTGIPVSQAATAVVRCIKRWRSARGGRRGGSSTQLALEEMRRLGYDSPFVRVRKGAHIVS